MVGSSWWGARDGRVACGRLGRRWHAAGGVDIGGDVGTRTGCPPPEGRHPVLAGGGPAGHRSAMRWILVALFGSWPLWVGRTRTRL